MSKVFKIEVVETIRHYYTIMGEDSDTAETIEEKFWKKVDEKGELPDSEYGEDFDRLVTIVTEENLQ